MMTSTTHPSPRRFLLAGIVVPLTVGALAQACGSAPEVSVPATAPLTTGPTTTAAPTSTVAPTATPVVTAAPLAAAAPRTVPATVRKAPQAVAAVPKPAPEPAPKPAPKPVAAAPKPAPEPAATSYASCAAVKAAGKAPIYAGDPGYSSKLDRDGDGVGCET